MFEKVDLIATQQNHPVGLLIKHIKNVEYDNSDDSAIFQFSQKSSNNSSSVNKENDETLEINQNIPIKIYFKNGDHIDYSFTKTIAKGSYGYVSIYSQSINDTYPLTICVKTGVNPDDIDSDAKVVKLLNQHKCQGTIVDCFTIKLTEINEYILIMEHLNGNLKHFFSLYNFNSLNDKYLISFYILSKISTCFYHLLSKDLYYTDIKITNCLYHILDDNKLKVVLCDIGSAVLSDESDSISTYPNIYRKKCHNFVPETYDLIYGLLVLFFDMMSIGKQDNWNISRSFFDQLFYKNITNLTIDERLNIINILFDELDTINGNNKQLSKLVIKLKQRTILTAKSIDLLKHSSPKIHLVKLYQFFRECYQTLLKTSLIEENDEFLILPE